MQSKTLNENLRREIDSLRQHVDELAASDDDELMRYEVLRPRMPPGFYWKIRWLAGRFVRWLEFVGVKKPDPWPVGLKQVPGSERAMPLLIWAVGTDRRTLRAGCSALADLQDALQGFAPVLVTDVADFAFFSRLGWLVEYLPEISGEGEPYARRKARFVARLYRAAPVLPINAPLEGISRQEMCRWLLLAKEQVDRSSLSLPPRSAF